MKNFILVLAMMSVGSAFGEDKDYPVPVRIYGEDVEVSVTAESQQKAVGHLVAPQAQVEKRHVKNNENSLSLYLVLMAQSKKLERMEAKQDCMIAAMNAGAPESVNGCLKNKKVDSKFYVNPNSIGGGSSSGSGANSLAH